MTSSMQFIAVMAMMVAAEGYCTGTAQSCSSLYSSKECSSGTNLSSNTQIYDTCPSRLKTCESTCEGRGAAGCKCSVTQDGCSSGSLYTCDSTVKCNGSPN